MDKSALFGRYIDENIDQIYRFAFSQTGNKQDAEDAVNDSVVKALKSLNRLGPPYAVKSWFYRIVVNTCMDIHRRNKRRNHQELEEAAPEYHDDYSTMNFAQMIETLDEHYRQILILHYFEGFTLKETALILDLNENTLKSRLYRALRQLKIEEGAYES